MYIIVYDDNGNQIKIPVSLGKEGDILRMVKGVPTWTPQDYTPPAPILEVDAGPNRTIEYGNTVTLSATSEQATTYKWELVPQEGTEAITLLPPTDGNLVIDGSRYLPGAVITLTGTYKSVTINNLIGTPEKPIIIKNNPFSKVTIGNSSWAGSGPAYGLKTSNSRYFSIRGHNQGDITIAGSTVNTLSPGNEPWKSAYRNMTFDNFSEYFEIINVTTTNGGTSIVAKTDPTTNSQTWYPNRTLGYMIFRNVVVLTPYNEGFYIGHTATYWDTKNNVPIYTTPTDPNTQKQPILISKVSIDHCATTGGGKDGIQTAAIKYIEVSNCEVSNWAIQKNTAHNGGILIGGRVEQSIVANNYVHDGWGEGYQFYGTGPNHTLVNNIFNNNQGDMISLAGRSGATVYLSNNTITDSGPNGNLVRVNGYFNKINGKDIIQAVLRGNLLAGPHNNMANGGTVYDKYYIYQENPATGIAVDEGNFKTPSSLNLDSKSYGYGATKQVYGPTDVNPQIETPDKSITQVFNLLRGTYTFKVIAANADQSATDTVTITVV